MVVCSIVSLDSLFFATAPSEYETREPLKKDVLREDHQLSELRSVDGNIDYQMGFVEFKYFFLCVFLVC